MLISISHFLSSHIQAFQQYTIKNKGTQYSFPILVFEKLFSNVKRKEKDVDYAGTRRHNAFLREISGAASIKFSPTIYNNCHAVHLMSI